MEAIVTRNNVIYKPRIPTTHAGLTDHGGEATAGEGVTAVAPDAAGIRGTAVQT